MKNFYTKLTLFSIYLLSTNLFSKVEQTRVRKSDHPVVPFIVNRRSRVAFDSETPVSRKQLKTLLEAMRWAPSSYNNQPWRVVYAHKGTSEWETLFNLLVEPNQAWAKNATVLMTVFSYNKFERNGKPSRTHSFDTGLAVQNLLIQAESMGLATHVMEGFDDKSACTALNAPADYTAEVMIAIGHPGNLRSLSPELRQREQPSERKKINEFAFEGSFPLED